MLTLVLNELLVWGVCAKKAFERVRRRPPIVWLIIALAFFETCFAFVSAVQALQKRYYASLFIEQPHCQSHLLLQFESYGVNTACVENMHASKWMGLPWLWLQFFLGIHTNIFFETISAFAPLLGTSAAIGMVLWAIQYGNVFAFIRYLFVGSVNMA